MDILSYFNFEPAGQRLEDLETPVPVIDIDVVERNLRKWQERCDKAGFANRPHIKTHKLPQLVVRQMELGITKFKCATIAEAELAAGLHLLCDQADRARVHEAALGVARLGPWIGVKQPGALQ